MIPNLHAARGRAPAQRYGGTAPRGPSHGAVVPYDYAATFQLTGRPGNVVQDVITISPDGVFVAVAIGYGFQEVRTRPLEILRGDATTTIAPQQITLGQIPESALIEGVRVNPSFDSIVFKTRPQNGPPDRRVALDFSDQLITSQVANQAFQRVKPRRETAFLFSLVDTASGRELQDEPAANLASLGKSDGQRPFRLLAQPVSFLPRSTIRLQIVERTDGVHGTLFVVLYGYKVLVGSACPESSVQALLRSVSVARGTPYAGLRGVVPFDYVTKFTLEGRPGDDHEDEVSISAEGGFVATAIGYGLSVADESVQVFAERAAAARVEAGRKLDLAKLPLAALSMTAVADGVRFRPEYLRFVLKEGGGLATIPVELAQEAFERLNRPEDVSFQYAVHDTGIGRDWQNQPIHNIAGLGIGNGLRPFKKLARPRILEPRSTLRVTVREDFGKGVLFIVLQGYKIPTAPGRGGGR
jgi:hypothetical protein